jgi:hypothetical protein
MTQCLLLVLECLVLQVVDYTSADYVELYKGQPFDIVVDAIAGNQGTRRSICQGVKQTYFAVLDVPPGIP